MISPRSMKMTRLAMPREPAFPVGHAQHRASCRFPGHSRLTIVQHLSLTCSGPAPRSAHQHDLARGSQHSEQGDGHALLAARGWPGNFLAWSGMRTRSRYFMAVASASARGFFQTHIGPSASGFSSTVRCETG